MLVELDGREMRVIFDILNPIIRIFFQWKLNMACICLP